MSERSERVVDDTSPERPDSDSSTGTDTPADTGTSTDTGESRRRTQPTLLEQMGGIGGMLYSVVPVLVFVLVNAATSLMPAIWAAVGSALLLTVLRLVRGESLQPALSGVFGVAIAAFIAYKTGSAKGYFAWGIWTSVVFAAAFLVSVVVRWPLAGVLWSALNGNGYRWRSDRKARRCYDVATLVWVLVFASRFLVQQYLYDSSSVGWLAVARIGMGLPLTAVAALVTIWAVRIADRREKELQPASAGSTAGAKSTDRSESERPEGTGERDAPPQRDAPRRD